MFTPFDTTEIKRIASASENPKEVEQKLLTINQVYWQLENEDEAERCRHRDAMEAIWVKMRSLQHKCPHPTDACQFAADPYESGYSCDVCGADQIRPRRKKLL
jgi:hypothetical protein